MYISIHCIQDLRSAQEIAPIQTGSSLLAFVGICLVIIVSQIIVVLVNRELSEGSVTGL